MSSLARVFRSVKFLKATGAKRAFGAVSAHGDGHGHHAPPGPYDPPQHEHPNREKAFLFGEDPENPKPSQGWEIISYISIAAFFAIYFAGWYIKGGDPSNSWAAAEAVAREAILARGEELEYGKYYSEEPTTKTEFTEGEDLDTAPAHKEKE